MKVVDTRTQIGGPTGNPDGVFGAMQIVDETNTEYPIKLNLCTCERPWLNNLPQKSCIPASDDYVLVRHTMQSGYFKGLETFMVTGAALEGRSGICIHPGKVDDESEGCVLVGESFDMRNVSGGATKFGLVKCEEAHAAFMKALEGLDNVPMEVKWRAGLP